MDTVVQFGVRREQTGGPRESDGIFQVKASRCAAQSKAPQDKGRDPRATAKVDLRESGNQLKIWN